MASTYTLNNGIELIGTGEQSGTWGDTTNTNLSLLDTALDGQVTVTLPSAGTSGSPNTLAIADGSASDGRNRMVIFNDGGDLGATAYVQLTPNDAEKIIYIRNDLAGSRSIILFQGTYNASNDYEVPAGTTAVIFFDGAGSGAVAANVFNNAQFDAMNIVGDVVIGGDLTVDTDTLYVDSTNNNVGIGESSPINITDYVGLTLSDTTGGFIRFKNDAGTQGAQITGSGSSLQIETIPALPIIFYTNGTDAMRIDSSQRVLIGTSSSVSVGTAGLRLQVSGTSFANSSVSFSRYDTSTSGPTLSFAKSRGTTSGDFTVVQDGDELGKMRFYGANGSNFTYYGAEISAIVDGEPGTGGDTSDIPGRLVFSTTPDGAGSVVERMRITNAGYVGINDTSPGVSLTVKNHNGDHPIAVQIWGADNTSEYLGLGQNGGDSVITAGHSGGSNTDLVLRTADGGVETNRVRISGATGNVQIGTDQSIDTATNLPLQIARNGGSLIKQSADYSGSVNGLYWLLTAAGTNRYTGGIYGNTSVTGGEAQNAVIRFWNEQSTPTSSDSPGYITFATTADGTAASTERMRILSNGTISMGPTFSPNGRLGIIQTNTTDLNGISGIQVLTDTSSTRYAGFGINDSTSGKEGLVITAGSGSTYSNDIIFRTAASGNETERMRITRDGMVLINSDDEVSATAGSTPVFQIQGASFAYSTASVWAFRNSANGPTLSLGHTRTDPVGSGRTIVQDGDELGKIRFYGADGVNFDNYGANIAAKVNGTPGADDMPGALVFGTTADGGVSSTDRMQINSAGRVSMSGNAGSITVKGDAALTLSDLKAGNLGGNISFHYDGNTGYATIGTTNTNDLILEADPSSVGASSAIRFNIDGNEVGRFQSDKIFRADTELWVTDGGYDSDQGLRIRPKVGNNKYGFSDIGTTYNIFMINEEGSTNQAMVIGDVGATNNTLFGVSNATGGANPTDGTTGSWVSRMELKGNGSLSLPNQPASRVRWSIAAGNELQDVIGGSGPSGTLFRYGWDILPTDAAVTFSEQVDNGGNVDSNGRFTAPASGMYAAQFFFYHEAPDGTNEEFKVTISINGGQTEYLVAELEQNPAYTIPRIQGWSGVFGLNAGDTLAPGFVPTAGGLNFEVPIALFSVHKVA